MMDRESKRFEEPLELELLLAEDVSIEGGRDRLMELYGRLNEVLMKIPNTYDEIKLEVSCSGFVRRTVQLRDSKMCHARISIRFEYEAEKPMPKLLRWTIIPEVYRARIHNILNTDNSVVLDNLYTMGYSHALAKETELTMGAVVDLLKKDGYLVEPPEPRK